MPCSRAAQVSCRICGYICAKFDMQTWSYIIYNQKNLIHVSKNRQHGLGFFCASYCTENLFCNVGPRTASVLGAMHQCNYERDWRSAGHFINIMLESWCDSGTPSCIMVRDSIVSVVTMLWAVWPRNCFSSKVSRWVLGSTQSPIQCVPGLWLYIYSHPYTFIMCRAAFTCFLLMATPKEIKISMINKS
jgi:hypothetical protein